MFFLGKYSSLKKFISVSMEGAIYHKSRDLERRMMRIAQIYDWVLLFFPMKAAAFDVPF